MPTPLKPSVAIAKAGTPRDYVIAPAIFVLALAVRLIFLSQAQSCPLFDHLIVDARAYSQWADQIAAGDWLGDRIYYQAPLYPYFLALLKTAGAGIDAIRIIQAIIGAMTCAIVSLAGQFIFGRAAGIAAGIMLALYPPAIFFDAIIQKANLGSLYIALLLLVLAAQSLRPSAPKSATAGLLLGMLMLTREETILLAPVMLMWILIIRNPQVVNQRPANPKSKIQNPKSRLANAAMFLFGLTIPLLPVAARNYYVGGEFVLTTAQAGPNFFIGNNPNATGVYAPLRPGRSDTVLERLDAVELAEQAAGRKLSASGVSRYWLGRAFTYIRHEPIAWLKLLLRKALLLINAYEIPDAENQYFYEEFSPLLRALSRIWNFGIMLPLAITGIVFARRASQDITILLVLIITLSMGVVLFYVFGRYRFTLVPPMMLLAGFAVTQILAMLRSGNWRAIAMPLIAALLIGIPANWPIFTRHHHFAESFSNAGAAVAAAGDDRRAVDLFQQALQYNSAIPDTICNLAMSRARLHGVHEAIPLLRNGLTLRSDDPRIEMLLGTALAESGELMEALTHLERAVKIAPGDIDSRVNYQAVLSKLGRWRESIEQLRVIVAMRPDDPGILSELAWILATCPELSLRDGPAAVSAAESAVRIAGQNNPELLDILACAYAQAGRFDQALSAASRARQIAQNQSLAELAHRIDDHIQLFRQNRPIPSK